MNWTRAKNVVWEEIFEGEALLVNPATGARWTLNATATALWKLCDGQVGTAELAALLARSRDEVAHFCAQFKQMGLLTPALVSTATRTRGSMTPLTLSRMSSAPSFKPLGLGSGPRRRPSARGVSGPA